MLSQFFKILVIVVVCVDCYMTLVIFYNFIKLTDFFYEISSHKIFWWRPHGKYKTPTYKIFSITLSIPELSKYLCKFTNVFVITLWWIETINISKFLQIIFEYSLRYVIGWLMDEFVLFFLIIFLYFSF